MTILADVFHSYIMERAALVDRVAGLERQLATARADGMRCCLDVIETGLAMHPDNGSLKALRIAIRALIPTGAAAVGGSGDGTGVEGNETQPKGQR